MVYQPLNVGSVEPLEIGQLVVGVRLLNGLERRAQVGAASRAICRKSSSGFSRSEKSNGPVTSNCSTGVRSLSSCSS